MAVSAFKIAFITETNFDVLRIYILIPIAIFDLLESFICIDGRVAFFAITDIVVSHGFDIPAVITTAGFSTVKHF
jgi:hypothetical protein